MMIRYVALLRGIAPSNPNMRNERLCSVFENLGFEKVQTVISTGNVLFESSSKNVAALEKVIEPALPAQLGFTSTTIIRSREQLQDLVDANPFKGIQDTPESRLNVTFLKNPLKRKPKFPLSPENRSYKLLAEYERSIFSAIDLTSGKTPDLMSFLDKQFGKEITTRTWKTVHRILLRLNY